jgi:hypothetical protein
MKELAKFGKTLVITDFFLPNSIKEKIPIFRTVKTFLIRYIVDNFVDNSQIFVDNFFGGSEN